MSAAWHTYQIDTVVENEYLRYVLYAESETALGALQCLPAELLAKEAGKHAARVERYTWFSAEQLKNLRQDSEHFESSGELFPNAKGQMGMFVRHGDNAVVCYKNGAPVVEEEYYMGQLAVVRRLAENGDVQQSFAFEDNNTLASVFKVSSASGREITLEEHYAHGQLHGTPAVIVKERDTGRPLMAFNYHAGELVQEWTEAEMQEHLAPFSGKTSRQLDAERKHKREYPFP